MMSILYKRKKCLSVNNDEEPASPSTKHSIFFFPFSCFHFNTVFLDAQKLRTASQLPLLFICGIQKKLQNENACTAIVHCIQFLMRKKTPKVNCCLLSFHFIFCITMVMTMYVTQGCLRKNPLLHTYS